MAENPALTRHKKLTEQILWLQKEIQASKKGISKSESDFNYTQFTQNWNNKKSPYKSLSTGKNLKRDIDAMLKALTSPKDSKRRELSVSLDPRFRSNDPESVLKFLEQELDKTEKYLGTKLKKDRGMLMGIPGDGPGSKLLTLGTVNDRYVREFDKDIFYKERELSIQAQNKFKAENRDTWHQNYDDPYKGWRQYLDVTHSEHPKSPNKSPINSALKSNKDNVTNDIKSNTNQSSSLGIGSRWEGNTLYGGGGFIGRNTDVRMSDGGSTVFTKAAADFLHIKKGEHLGVLTNRQRQMYDDLYINNKR